MAKKKLVSEKKPKYFEAVGRRKTAVASVRIFYGGKDGQITINGRKLLEYFPLKKLQLVALSPLKALSLQGKSVNVLVSGGGKTAQAEAVRLGIARALIIENSAWRPKLKALGYLRRDPRRVERKKFGSRKARRPQQWRKR